MKKLTLLWLRRVGLSIGIAAALAGAWAGYLRISGNFHPVEQGLIYRSAQLSGAEFSQRIAENGIRTIINLRGNNTGRPWYSEEMKASQAAGVTHIDFALSASKELTDDQITRLTALLRESVKPILIHCEGGADRSGIASALYELLVAKKPVEEASRQLSFRYGHFPWLISTTFAMDDTFKRVVSSNGLTRAVD